MNKQTQLEQTILELGTELIRLKSEISDVKNHQNKFIEVIKGLKQIMDEKGIIQSDDFENSVDIANTLSHNNFDPSLEEEIARIKKIHH